MRHRDIKILSTSNVLERFDFGEKKDRLVDEDRSKVEGGIFFSSLV